MQEAVALAHLSVATGSGDDDEEVSIPWPEVSDGMPRLLPVPSAWWETPAVTTRALSARPEEARTARRFVREMLTCWGLEALADDAEMIVDDYCLFDGSCDKGVEKDIKIYQEAIGKVPQMTG